MLIFSDICVLCRQACKGPKATKLKSVRNKLGEKHKAWYRPRKSFESSTTRWTCHLWLSVFNSESGKRQETEAEADPTGCTCAGTPHWRYLFLVERHRQIICQINESDFSHEVWSAWTRRALTITTASLRPASNSWNSFIPVLVSDLEELRQQHRKFKAVWT